MEKRQSARLIMEAVGVLHDQGFGLLKLYCYCKEGLGSWRYLIFASPSMPESPERIEKPILICSGDWSWGGLGNSLDEVVASISSRDKLVPARGHDPVYVPWYAKMLNDSAPAGLLQMEQPAEASVDGYSYPVPAEWLAFPVWRRY